MPIDQPSKILLVRYSALGDVIQTVPILSMLRESFPAAKIGWAIDAELVPAVAGHPSLDYIHPCHRRRWSRSLAQPAQWRQTRDEICQFIGSIKSIDYDVAIDAQGLFKTALLPFLAGIKRRIGYSHGRELSSFFYNERYLNLKEYFDPSVFHLDHMAVLARAVGAADVRHTIEAPRTPVPMKEKIAAMLQAAFSTNSPIIAMAPATQWVSKAWPLENWVALLDDVLTKTPLNVVMVGAKSDIPVVERVLRPFSQQMLQGRLIDLSGKTSIPEMYALYEQVQAAVGSDSAPLHIAGAVKTPYLFGIFGPTGYRRTPPIGSEHIKLFSTEIDKSLACQPCHKKTCPLGTNECLIAIKPSQVFQAIQEVFCNSHYAAHK